MVANPEIRPGTERLASSSRLITRRLTSSTNSLARKSRRAAQRDPGVAADGAPGEPPGGPSDLEAPRLDSIDRHRPIGRDAQLGQLEPVDIPPIDAEFGRAPQGIVRTCR